MIPTKLTWIQQYFNAFKRCTEKNELNKSRNDVLEDFRLACSKALNFCLSKRGIRFFWFSLVIAAGLDAIFVSFYFGTIHFLPQVSSEQQWLPLIMLFFCILLFLGFMTTVISLCVLWYRDAFVKKELIENGGSKSFAALKKYIMATYVIMMCIDASILIFYDAFHWVNTSNYFWILLKAFAFEMFLCSLVSAYIFEKFGNRQDLLPFSAWKIMRTLFFSRLGFFVYALFFYFLCDYTMRAEIWFFPLLQCLLFLYHFMFVSDRKALASSSVIFSMFIMICSPIIILGIFGNVDKGIMGAIGVSKSNVIIEFDKRVCSRAARALQCTNSLFKENFCIFYNIDEPSAVGSDRLVNIPINQFINLTGCVVSDEMKAEIKNKQSVALQMIVSEKEMSVSQLLKKKKSDN